MPKFYLSVSVKINIEQMWPSRLRRFKPDPLTVKPSGAPGQNVTIALRIESRRMADLEIKFKHTASKVVHVPF